MIPRNRWKRIIAATMLAGMAANGCAVFAAEVQPELATQETSQTEQADATATLYAAADNENVAVLSLDNQDRNDAITTQGTEETTLASIDFTQMDSLALPEGWTSKDTELVDAPADPDGKKALLVNDKLNAGLTYSVNDAKGKYSSITIKEDVYLTRQCRCF